ncbi:hypothetical protein D3C71_2092800 [compost metagenome]
MNFLWLAKFADDLSLLLAKYLQSGKSKVLPTKESSLEAHLVLCYDDHARFRANMLIITCS